MPDIVKLSNINKQQLLINTNTTYITIKNYIKQDIYRVLKISDETYNLSYKLYLIPK